MLGAMVAVRCPQEFADIILRAGGLWEPGSRRWLVERRRIGPVIRALQRATDPLVPARWHVAGLGSVQIWDCSYANDPPARQPDSQRDKSASCGASKACRRPHTAEGTAAWMCPTVSLTIGLTGSATAKTRDG